MTTLKDETLWPAYLIEPQLRTMPSWELEAQREHWSRQASEVEARPAAWFGGLCAAFVYHAQIDLRLEIVQAELDRRSAVERHGGVRRAEPRFTADFLEEVKRRVSLPDLIVHDYPETKLKRVGLGFIGHCPWHEDSTPSLHVWDEPSNAHYFCFGCLQGGDVFTFLEVQDAGRSFLQCVEIAARWAGIAIPDRQRAIGIAVPEV